MRKRVSKKNAQKAPKRVLRTPPGDLPEASRRRKSTPKGASGDLDFSKQLFFRPRGPPGSSWEPPGPLPEASGSLRARFSASRASPGPSRDALRHHFGLVLDSSWRRFVRLCKRPKSDKQRNMRTRSHPNQRGETTDTTRIQEQAHTQQHTRNIAEHLTGKCA